MLAEATSPRTCLRHVGCPLPPRPAPQVPYPQELLTAPLASARNGLVARGTLRLDAPQPSLSCTVDGATSGTTTCCSPAVACDVSAGCFEGLCQYSASSLSPNTTYRVGRLGRTCNCLAGGKPLPRAVAAPPGCWRSPRAALLVG